MSKLTRGKAAGRERTRSLDDSARRPRKLPGLEAGSKGATTHSSPAYLKGLGRVCAAPPEQHAPGTFTRLAWTDVAALLSVMTMFGAMAGGLLFVGQIGFNLAIYRLLLPL